MKSVKLILTILSIYSMFGCTATMLGARTIPIEKTNTDYTITTNVSFSVAEKAVLDTIKNLKWKRDELHQNILNDIGNKKPYDIIRTEVSLDSEFMLAWRNVSPSDETTKLSYIKAKTPISLSSFGASIFVGIYEVNGSAVVRLSASTTQISEKEKLESHLDMLKTKIIAAL